jgi:hypothetical protein
MAMSARVVRLQNEGMMDSMPQVSGGRRWAKSGVLKPVRDFLARPRNRACSQWRPRLDRTRPAAANEDAEDTPASANNWRPPQHPRHQPAG